MSIEYESRKSPNSRGIAEIVSLNKTAYCCAIREGIVTTTGECCAKCSSDKKFPVEIRAPLLLAHAEWDNDVPFVTTADLFKRCTNTPWRRWLEIGEGSHMILLEKNHWQSWDAITGF